MKYFCVSDIHSFANELKAALKQAGFDKKNKEHILVVLGDLFDRGSGAVDTYNFIHSIPKSRRVLIRGNHEDLYFALLNKEFPESYDFHNCTVDTFCQIAADSFSKDQTMLEYLSWCNQQYFESNYHNGIYFYEDEINYTSSGTLNRRWSYIIEAVKNHPITKWLKSNEWKNYYELDKYIFVHSFIPVKLKQEAIDKYGMIAYGFENPAFYEYISDWREANWDEAVWGCPWAQYRAGLFAEEEAKGKTLVCGHWHTTDFYKHLKHIHLYDKWSIYYSKGLIGLDGGVHYGPFGLEHEQNVLVIDSSDFRVCYDKTGNVLEECNFMEERKVETVTIMPDGTKIAGSSDFIEE